MCPTESDIIRLVAGEIADTRSAEILAHLDQCTECRRRYEAISATFLALTEWEIPQSPRDCAPVVLARVRRAALVRTAMAIAASVVVASSLGIATAIWTSPQPAPIAQVPSAPTAEQAAICLGLDVFGGESIGLSEVFAHEEHQ